MKNGTILVADDDAVTRRLLDHHLSAAGFETILASDGAQALAALADPNNEIDLALFDLQMPKVSGLECLRAAHKRFPDLPVLVISQFGEVKDAVRAMKEGAFEYIAKPIDPDELLVHVESALRARRLVEENRELRQAVGGAMPAAVPAVAPAPPDLGRSDAARRLLDQLDRIRSLDASVLITGESGTGKTTLARWIHQHSPRSAGPFVAVSCATLPRDLIEAELFGHARGAFTGAVADRPGRAEMAHGGTLFLDEIGDLPLELQPKLLTFLQDRTVQRIGEARLRAVNVRVLAATHQDLAEKVRSGSFRQDLFFRLNVLPIRLAPIRERPEDIEGLAGAILERIARQRGLPPISLAPDAVRALRIYSWPGNIRELENVLERATAFSSGPALGASDLGLDSSPLKSTSMAFPTLAGRTLADIERQAIADTLRSCDGNKKAAARMLGIDEKSIYNKIKRLGVPEP